MIAEEAAKGHYSGVRRIFHVTLAFMTVVAVVCGLALPFGAHGLVEMGIVRDSRAFPALAVLAPALSLSVIACCFRGYFQGLQLMTRRHCPRWQTSSSGSAPCSSWPGFSCPKAWNGPLPVPLSAPSRGRRQAGAHRFPVLPSQPPSHAR